MPRQFTAQYFQHLSQRTRPVVRTCIYGLGAGMATVAFQLAMNWLYRLGLVQLSHQSTRVFLVGSLAIMAGSALLVGWLLNSFCQDAAGSGIPQLKLAFWKDFGTVPWRVAWVKFVAGVLSIGGGASLGREGPSVQLAGAVASNLAGLTGEARQNRRAAAAAGASAGLAAAFNTPLAATTFVLEEIIGDLNSRFLGGVLLAAVLGALIVHGVIGKQPSFTLGEVDAPSWVGYVLTPLVAAAASVIGVYFQRAALGLRRAMKTKKVTRGWLLPLAGALTTWLLGASIFCWTGHLGVFGLGYDDLSGALAGHLGWELAAVLLAAKFIATFTCYGFGGCGGIFSPTLFLGGMTGTMIAGLISLRWNIPHADALTLAVVGMSACLGAVVWAPVTGILIVFEMTHEFSLVPALMLGALVSQAISRKMNRENFYEELLTQDGHQIEHVRPPRDLQEWQQLPVSAIANFRPMVLKGLEPSQIQQLFDRFPYERFPVLQGDRLAGILTRREGKNALAENRVPALQPATTCRPDQTVRQLQGLLIESPTQMVVLFGGADGSVVGLITLHDLLRMEVQKAQGSRD